MEIIFLFVGGLLLVAGLVKAGSSPVTWAVFFWRLCGVLIVAAVAVAVWAAAGRWLVWPCSWGLSAVSLP